MIADIKFHFLQEGKSVLPLGYIDSLEIYNRTHSRELLNRVGQGRQNASYGMLEEDVKKASTTYRLNDHGHNQERYAENMLGKNDRELECGGRGEDGREIK